MPDRPDYARRAWIGRTFGCLASTGDLWCIGDNAFGQLGSDKVTSPSTPAYLHMGPVSDVSLGAMHGCALTNAHAVFCWGRDDYGQIGVVARETCSVGQLEVPCSRVPQKLPFSATADGVLRAGDMFTCLSDALGIACWGASRDGFFGKPESCPPDLHERWPTWRSPWTSGERRIVSAPRAACSRAPDRLAGAHTITTDYDAGPRGVCFVIDRKLQCVGAIPTPRTDASLEHVRVSPGQDASACALGPGGAVLCWGEGYSPAAIPDQPVRVVLEASPSNTVEMSKRSCPGQVHASCPRAPTPAPCTSDLQPVLWSALAPSAGHFEGRIVRVRGPLTIGGIAQTVMGCSPGWCCNGSSARMAIGGAVPILELEGMGLTCRGDESGLCCERAGLGQSIIATGRLTHLGPPQWALWTLSDAKICLDAAASGIR